MLLFEKSLIGTYCNRLYNLKEKQDPFSCQGRIKANSADKNLNVTSINTKAGPPNCQTCLPPNSSFFMGQNDHHLNDAISFDYVSSPFPLTLLKITNSSLCHCSFEYFQSSLINQHDYHYMYRRCGLYLVKHFVVAQTNVCTVKLTQLH